MRRKYIHRIQVWVSDPTDDGFGGSTITPAQLGSSWCNIKTLTSEKLIAYGLDITKQAITIKTRWRSDLDYFRDGLYFKYKNADYMPTSITEKDLESEEITIIAERI